MRKARYRTFCGTILAAVAALAATAVFADTDVYGNEIKTYTENGNQITYRFWISGDMAEDAAKASASTAVHVVSDGFETRCRTALSRILSIDTRPWSGLMMIFR